MRTRGFEIISTYKDQNINLPARKTIASAGYDLEAANTVVIPAKGTGVVTTGIKAYMLQDEYLAVNIRSSLGFKKSLCLVNSVGIIDSDYYNNPDNEGHIMIGLYNFGDQDVEITKGTRVAQGIFTKYYIVDHEEEITTTRQGGFGSTGE